MKVLVMLSGGVDSQTLASHAIEAGLEVSAAFVDYGQPARVPELAAARAWAARTHCRLTEFTVAGLPLGQMATHEGPQVVPGRNAMLVSLGVAAASHGGCEVVWIGATADDFADYADCRPAWVEAMSRVAQMATGVRVDAPFSGWTKRQILARAAQLQLDTAAMWSCYEPRADLTPCGECASCAARKWASL